MAMVHAITTCGTAEGEHNTIVVISTAWFEEMEESDIWSYARSDNIAQSYKAGVYLNRLYIPQTPMPCKDQFGKQMLKAQTVIDLVVGELLDVPNGTYISRTRMA